MTSEDRAVQIEVLVGDLALDSIGADEELLSIVIDELRPLTERPYGEIVHRLLGKSDELDEAQSQKLWSQGMEHRRALSDALGRPVHLRTALVDLLASRGLKPGVKIAELLGEDRPGADEITGALRSDVFSALVDHQAQQRVREPAVIAFVSLMSPVENGFEPVDDHALLASLANLARKRFRRSDAMGLVDHRTLGLLLIQCQPEKAATLLKQLDQDIRQAHPERALRLAHGVTVLDQGKSGAASLERASLRLQQWAHSQSHTTMQALWPLAVFATTSAQRFHEVHDYFAARGWALLMAKDRATADQAIRRLRPSLLLADVLLPPGGGLELVENITREGLPTAGFLVAPARWSSLSRGKSLTFTTLHLPLVEANVEPILERHLGPPRAPMGPLAGELDAEAMSAALATLLTGWRLPPQLEDAVGGRPELQVVRARLATNAT